MGRKNKALRIDHGYPHREHRSKKGRTYRPDIYRVRNYKKRLEELTIKELDKEIKNL